jgi:hypothetical protein
MPTTRVVKAQDIVKDIRERLSDDELKAKYKFTSSVLQAVLKQLVDIRAISRAEIFERFTPSEKDSAEEDVQIASLRKLPRHMALFPIPIYDGKNPKISGMLRDLNEKGVGVSGIDTTTGETRTFVILGDEFVAVEFDTFSFDAVCRWVRIEDDGSPYISGFEITRIDDKDLTELHKLIMSLTVVEPDA